MKIKEIKDLSFVELEHYRQSELYLKATCDYATCDVHLEYYKEYFGNDWSDLSLVAFDDKGFYLCMYIYFQGSELSFWGNPVTVYSVQINAKDIIKIYQEIFARLEKYKEMHNVTSLKIYQNEYFAFKYFDVISKGGDIEYYSYIDLNQEDDSIRMNLRKSYKSLVNWGYRNLRIEIFDSSNILESVVQQFEDFHIQVSKRRTRSHESWLLQYKAVKKGMAYIVFGYLNENLVAAVLILHSNYEAYYGVAVNDRDLMAQNLPIGHAVLFESILEAKRKGLKRFNLGNVSQTSDNKINAITKYKRGFSSVIETKIVYNINL